MSTLVTHWILIPLPRNTERGLCLRRHGSSDYIVEHDTSGRKARVTGRNEELLAHRMFLAGSTISFRDWYPVKIVDFQTPLNAVQGDGLGKVDLLGSGRGMCVIDLKVVGGDTPLNALLEAVGYCADCNPPRIDDRRMSFGHAGHHVRTGWLIGSCACAELTTGNGGIGHGRRRTGVLRSALLHRRCRRRPSSTSDLGRSTSMTSDP